MRPRAKRSALAGIAALGCALALSWSAHADVTIPAGGSITLDAGGLDAGCTDLIVLGTLHTNSAQVSNVRNLIIQSGGLIDAVSHVAERIPLDAAKVHAVEIYFNEDGSYLGFDTASPLTRQSGKRELLKELRMLPPVLMVGDGMTDVETRPAVDAFAAFTGFVRREQTVAAADHVVSNFHELLELVMK